MSAIALMRENERVVGLTNRQQQIAALACHGLANKEIAARLGLSEGTVKVQLHTIYQKLRIRRRTELMLAQFELEARTTRTSD